MSCTDHLVKVFIALVVLALFALLGFIQFIKLISKSMSRSLWLLQILFKSLLMNHRLP